MLVHRGRVYASGQDRAAARYDDEASGQILVSDDEGRTFDVERYPGHEDDYVVAWTVRDGRPVAGTYRGSVLERRDGEWTRVGTAPGTIHAIAAV